MQIGHSNVTIFSFVKYNMIDLLKRDRGVATPVISLTSSPKEARPLWWRQAPPPQREPQRGAAHRQRWA